MNDAIDQNTALERTLESLATEQFLHVVGSRVRRYRLEINMSRKSLARKSGVSERYLAQLESGQGNISIALLKKVAGAINVKLGVLMSDYEIEEITKPKPEPVT